MIKKIDHIAIAVPSIEEARGYYENVLGLKLDHIEEVAEQKSFEGLAQVYYKIWYFNFTFFT